MRRVQVFACLLLLIWSGSGLLWAQDKPLAALLPLAWLGDINEVQQRFVFNELQGRLSQDYLLVPQEKVAAAQEAAFTELVGEECTEENCARFIQDRLKVDSLFSLQMARDAQYTQLTLSLVQEDKKLVRSAVCEGCDVRELNEMVAELVEDLLNSRPPFSYGRQLDSAFGEAPATPAPAIPADPPTPRPGKATEATWSVEIQYKPKGGSNAQRYTSWTLPGFGWKSNFGKTGGQIQAYFGNVSADFWVQESSGTSHIQGGSTWRVETLGTYPFAESFAVEAGPVLQGITYSTASGSVKSQYSQTQMSGVASLAWSPQLGSFEIPLRIGASSSGYAYLTLGVRW